MSHTASCRLTIQDHSILDTWLHTSVDPDDPLADLLRKKLAAASIWSNEDIAPTIVTLDSRISYRIDGGPADIRIISLKEAYGPVGFVLPATSLRGLALIGLDEGESFDLMLNGKIRSLSVVEVHYQPEAANREARHLSAVRPRPARPHLRLVHSADITFRSPANDHDDPGPSAA
ncbi:nucleoside-diphosphate kinase [Mesorhizobium sp. CAU 1732]|uniref:nucleoside-diphosphate kinase n=1 Tax=Mesorhizobium sp. CAU 1732 TaxID=3140358 RepID=UPI003260E8D0